MPKAPAKAKSRASAAKSVAKPPPKAPSRGKPAVPKFSASASGPAAKKPPAIVPKPSGEDAWAEEIVEDFINKRLKNVGKDVLASRRNSKGQSIRDVVHAEVLEKKSVGGRLSTQFRVNLFKDFNLKASPVDLIGKDITLEMLENCDPELQSRLAMLHADNPAQRKSEPFMKFLTYAGPFNADEMNLILTGIQEDAIVQSDLSTKLHGALLMHMARTDAVKNHNDIWHAYFSNFDFRFGELFSLLGTTGFDLSDFMEKYADVFPMFCKGSDFTLVREAIQKETDPPTAALDRVLASFKSARIIFQAQSIGLSYRLYTARVEKQIESLEHHNFEASEYESFARVMRADAKLMFGDNASGDEEMEIKVSIFGASDTMTVTEPNDTWYVPALLRMKFIAAVNKDVDRMPWEDLWFEASPPEDVPISFKVPERHLKENIAARRKALKTLGLNATTFKEMKEVMIANKKAICEHDRFFEHEIHFLLNHVEVLAMNHIQEAIVAEIPKEDSAATELPEVAKKIDEIYRGTLALACGKVFRDEIHAVLTAVRSLAEGQGPDAENIGLMSEFYRRVAKALEVYCSQEVVQKEGTSSVLFGRRALAWEYKRIVNIAANELPSISEFAMLRKFEWMLEKPKRVVLNKWVYEASLREELLHQKRLEDGDVQGDDGADEPSASEPAKASKSTSSSSKAAKKDSAATPSSAPKAAGKAALKGSASSGAGGASKVKHPALLKFIKPS